MRVQEDHQALSSRAELLQKDSDALQVLRGEHAELRGAHDTLAAAHEEQTAELATTQDALAEMTRLRDQATEWAHSLEVRLSELRATVNALNAELAASKAAHTAAVTQLSDCRAELQREKLTTAGLMDDVSKVRAA